MMFDPATAVLAKGQPAHTDVRALTITVLALVTYAIMLTLLAAHRR
jgi:hypothetical protein